MIKIFKNFIVIFLLFLPVTTKAHVQHYDNLKRIEFDILRNNKNIGKHIFSFKKKDNQLPTFILKINHYNLCLIFIQIY